LPVSKDETSVTIINIDDTTKNKTKMKQPFSQLIFPPYLLVTSLLKDIIADIIPLKVREKNSFLRKIIDTNSSMNIIKIGMYLDISIFSTFIFILKTKHNQGSKRN